MPRGGLRKQKSVGTVLSSVSRTSALCYKVVLKKKREREKRNKMYHEVVEERKIGWSLIGSMSETSALPRGSVKGKWKNRLSLGSGYNGQC